MSSLSMSLCSESVPAADEEWEEAAKHSRWYGRKVGARITSYCIQCSLDLGPLFPWCSGWQGHTAEPEAQLNSLFPLWQVQFDEREDTKSCTIVINDDDVFENVESFTVELSMPAYALLGEFTQAKVIINDTEDEPTLEFDKKTYRVNESAGFLFAPIERKGLLAPKMTRSYRIAMVYWVPFRYQVLMYHITHMSKYFTCVNSFKSIA